MVVEAGRPAYLVGATGADRPAGTPESPLRSIQTAINRAVAEGMGGDLYVTAGIYRGSINLGDGVSATALPLLVLYEGLSAALTGRVPRYAMHLASGRVGPHLF